jgi:hypothetical protein
MGAFFASQKTGLSAPIPQALRAFRYFRSIPCAGQTAERFGLAEVCGASLPKEARPGSANCAGAKKPLCGKIKVGRSEANDPVVA